MSTMRQKAGYQPLGYTYKETVAMAHTLYDTQDRICGCLRHRQATSVSAVTTLIYAALIIVHEVILERAFDLRNYVVIAFCLVWCIVTILLFVAICKAAPFLLLPWLVLSTLLTPLFVLAIVVGCRVLAICMSDGEATACTHELHIFGTLNHRVAIGKLALLVTMLFSNMLSILVVYKNYMLMTGGKGTSTQSKVDVQTEEGRCLFRYHRFQSDSDTSQDLAVCEELLQQPQQQT